MAANETKLGALHEKVATVLTEALEGNVIPAEFDSEGEEIAPEVRMPPSAAIITSAIQFLKNNNITCAPSEDNSMGKLRDAVAARQAQREQRRKTIPAPSLETDRMDFMDGLPKQ